MLKTIVESQRMIGKEKIIEVKGSVTIPNMKTLVEKSWQVLRNFVVTKVQWNSIATFGIALIDGQNCKAGTEYDFNNSYSFDSAKKITRI